MAMMLRRVFKIFFIFELVFIISISAYKSYSGYQLIRTNSLQDETTLRKINLLRTNPDYDFWTGSRLGRPVDIMTSSQHVEQLKKDLKMLGLETNIIIKNLATVVEEERFKIENLQHINNDNRAVTFDNFMTYDEIQAYLDEVVSSYPEIASLIELGSSYEGRVMKVLKLSSGEQGKSGMWIDAAIHAREWIAPPVALYAIQQLCLPQNRFMLDKNDFYILPVANPDGYSYTWTDERFWRKSRSPNSGTCIGTDLNRNFDWHWNESTADECSNEYAGSSPFAENESRAMAEFIAANQNIKVYIALHSYGQYILYPYAHTLQLPTDTTELVRIGTAAAEALQNVRGTEYTVGNWAELLYIAVGTSQDWAYGVANISLSYTIELPAGGSGGFNPPPEDIIPVVTETWEAIKVIAENIPTL